jgi:hypothetical protein
MLSSTFGNNNPLLNTGSYSTKTSPFGCGELSLETLTIDRDADCVNNIFDLATIQDIERVYGHYKLRIPKDWVAKNEYYDSDLAL